MVGLIARFGLASGVLLILGAALLLLVLTAGTAEFVVSTMTIALGAFLVLISAFALYMERKRR